MIPNISNVCFLMYEVHHFVLKDIFFSLTENIILEFVVMEKQQKVLKSHQWPWVGYLCSRVGDIRNWHMISSQSSSWNKLRITFKFEMIFLLSCHMPQGSFLLNPLSFCMYSENSAELSLHFSYVQSTVRVQIYFEINFTYIVCSINVYSINGLYYPLMIQFYKESSQLWT